MWETDEVWIAKSVAEVNPPTPPQPGLVMLMSFSEALGDFKSLSYLGAGNVGLAEF